MLPKQPHDVHEPAQTVQVTAARCHDLTLFKGILREYRKLDDTMIMRLNRANAQMRDRNRDRHTNEKQTPQDQACDLIWRELVANWTRRTQLIGFCVDVVDQSLHETQDVESMNQSQTNLKFRHIHNEVAVEGIIRKRSVTAFRSRCQYFAPPMTDVEARRMWDAASG